MFVTLREDLLKKQILLAIGVAGLFTCQPQHEAQADVRLGVKIPGGPNFFFSDRPDFVYLNDYGYSVSYGGPYDVIYYGDEYFIFRDGGWYRAHDYRGPWGRIRDFELPPVIRRHRIEDIRRYRDIEYRRHDHGYWNDRFRNDRDQWHGRDEHRGPDGHRGYDEHRGPDGHRGYDDHHGRDDRRDRDEHRGHDDRRGPDFDRR